MLIQDHSSDEDRFVNIHIGASIVIECLARMIHDFYSRQGDGSFDDGLFAAADEVTLSS